MPCGYTIDAGRRLVLGRGWQDVTGTMLVEYSNALGRDPMFERAFMQLFDFRRTLDLRLESHDVRTIAGVTPFGPGSRRVSLVATDLAFGLARMYEMLRDESGDALHVTRDLDDALLWLGIVQHKAAIVAALAAPPDVTVGP